MEVVARFGNARPTRLCVVSLIASFDAHLETLCDIWYLPWETGEIIVVTLFLVLKFQSFTT